MTKIISTTLRITIAAISLLMLIWVNLNFITAGTFIGTALFGAVFLITLLWKPFCGLISRIWGKFAGKLILTFLGGVIAFFAILCVIFSVKMAEYIEKPIDAPRAVIVLGCQVRGETPSSMLAYRLEAAIDVLNTDTDIICVVSGGKGSGENISEAEAMRRYLVDKGISEERVVKEDKSVSTRENIRFSSEILSQMGITDNIIIVTNDFHQYRADIYARENGFSSVGHYSSRTPLRNLLNYWVREWAAIMAVRLGI